MRRLSEGLPQRARLHRRPRQASPGAAECLRRHGKGTTTTSRSTLLYIHSPTDTTTTSRSTSLHSHSPTDTTFAPLLVFDPHSAPKPSSQPPSYTRTPLILIAISCLVCIASHACAQVHVINDEDPDKGGNPSIAAVLQRRSVQAVGDFHEFSYR